ncbi:hypothetical protein BC830DRAFT_1110771, partial [Chytriomyces sp. MP71]
MTDNVRDKMPLDGGGRGRGGGRWRGDNRGGRGRGGVQLDGTERGRGGRVGDFSERAGSGSSERGGFMRGGGRENSGSGTWRGGRGERGGTGSGGTTEGLGRDDQRSQHYKGAFTIELVSNTDLSRFTATLANTKAHNVSSFITQFTPVWLACWKTPSRINCNGLQTLLIALSRLPASSSCPPPPINHVVEVVDEFIKASSNVEVWKVAADVDLLINVVNVSMLFCFFEFLLNSPSQRLLKFLWTTNPSEVKDGLETILSLAGGCLSLRHQDHRKINNKITELFDELEKPWCIKFSTFEDLGLLTRPNIVSDAKFDHANWRSATIGWLRNQSGFNPYALPKMSVPGGRGNGKVSVLSFLLMIAITFEEGNSALSPLCRVRNENGTECGKVLRGLDDTSSSASGNLQCIKKSCQNRVVLCCVDRRHNFGLCGPCAEMVRQGLLGPAGPMASTQIYDGNIAKATFDGRLFVSDVASRKPPQIAPNWRTTKRLQAPNLIALVQLPARGSALTTDMKVVWAEIVEHSRYLREDEMRKQGKLSVSILQLEDVVVDSLITSELFRAGDAICIIDCQTFVPEFIPVLKALEMSRQMKPLPFLDGALLNLNFGKKARSITQAQVQAVDDVDIIDNLLLPETMEGGDITVDGTTRTQLYKLVAESDLEPIVQIRRYQSGRRLLEQKLLGLVQGATLDSGQFESFLGSLRHPVHCTQGPPGTGKSYLGVVIARALLLVREIWMKVSPSIATPPLLILSYKNHAIDEFLVDLVAAEPRVSMIRIGSIKDERLRPFSELNMAQSTQEVKMARRKLEELHDMKANLEKFLAGVSTFGLMRGIMFGPTSEDPLVEKDRRNSSYEAAIKIKEALLWLCQFRAILPCLAQDRISFTQISFILHPERSETFLNIDYDSIAPVLLQWERRKNILPSSILLKLYDGIKHYNEGMDTAEILWHFISGFIPRPLCMFQTPCSELATSSSEFCDEHRCMFDNEGPQCASAALEGKVFCPSHVCQFEDCQFHRLKKIQTAQELVPQPFCEVHGCFVCIRMNLSANLATDDPPRNVCEKHTLCVATSDFGSFCSNLAITESLYCTDHEFTQCSAVRRAGERCSNRAISRTIAFCYSHKADIIEWQCFSVSKVDSLTEEESVSAPESCMSLNGKGKPCKSKPLPGKSHCKDHLVKVTRQPWKILEPLFLSDQACSNSVIEEPSVAVAAEPPSADLTIVGASTPGASESYDMRGINAIAEVNIYDDFVTVDPFEVETENEDDIDVPDHLLHLHEVCTLEQRDSSLDDDYEVQPEEGMSENFDLVSEKADFVSPHLWGWELSLDERWAMCQDAIAFVSDLKQAFDAIIRKETDKSRRELHHAEVRSRSRVYEGKSVIGGTIVGCISRLEAIRNTNPFAILVEEASEVMEPLLFACLGKSTIKLEMVGDHFQLQPSMMSKFEFEQVNKMNISLFERLVRAPTGYKVPLSVLSIQRRMRPNIADLTRDFYESVTKILDHERCMTRIIGEDEVIRGIQPRLLDSTESRGWEVPGLSSNLFFWTHNGREERASVGLSKVNRTEAEMVCNLALFLVTNGVPITSIAIITPYKGQMTELRKRLENPPYRLIAFKNPRNSLILSTVDRFQGDESDIVIGSLVVDTNTKSPFARLVNRMIVLNSRARIGFYLVGNIGYFEKNSVEHWSKTINKLIEPSPLLLPGKDAEDVGIYKESRVGHGLPLCCPQHRDSTLKAESAKELKLGFCNVFCTSELSCGHKCGQKCHFPALSHQKQCPVPIESPCVRHPQMIECAKLFSLAKISTRSGIDAAKSLYRCDVLVELQLPCLHKKRLDCANENEITSGLHSIPVCNEPCLSPYIYTTCKHELKGMCHQITKYVANPGSVPQCSDDVEYSPPCGHSRNIPCYLYQRYLSGATIYVCPAKVTISLPRCYHSTQISCDHASKLNGYAGQTVQKIGRVDEGVQYGPVDALCNQSVSFRRVCGHVETMKCDRAFALTVGAGVCAAKETITNPFCGHAAVVSCSEKRDIEDQLKQKSAKAPSPIDNVSEGGATLYGLIRAKAHCSTKVTVTRKCGHFVILKCWESEEPLSPCREIVTVQSGLCGHSIQVACSDCVFVASVWDQEVVKPPEFTLLMERHILCDDAPVPVNINPLILPSLLSCKLPLIVKRASSCQHLVETVCSSAFKLLLNATPIKGLQPCLEQVVVQMSCGHSRLIECANSGKSHPCNQVVRSKCWNFEACGSVVEGLCGRSDTPRCELLTLWTCNSSVHTFHLENCSNGFPSDCPSCILDAIDCFRDAVASMMLASDPFVTDNKITVVPFQQTDDAYAVIERSKSLLSSVKAVLEDMSPWDRPILSPAVIYGFIEVDSLPQSFNLRSNIKFQTFNGIRIRLWTLPNLKKVIASLIGSQEKILLLIHGFTVKVLVNPKDLPTIVANGGSGESKKKTKNQSRVAQWINQQTKVKSYDSLQYSTEGWENHVFWEPFCVVGTGIVKASIDNLNSWIENRRFPLRDSQSRGPKLIQYNSPQDLSQSPALNRSHSELDTALSGTPAYEIKTDLSWNCNTLGLWGSFSPAVEKELLSKLVFVLKAKSKQFKSPYDGVKYLESLSEALSVPELKLLLALEMSIIDSKSEAEDQLMSYLDGAISDQAHPLVAVAVARILCQPGQRKTDILRAFVSTFGQPAKLWLLPTEISLLTADTSSLFNSAAHLTPLTPQHLWEDLKRKENVTSAAMDELMDLVGLNRVKISAIELFKAAIAFSKMPPAARKKNPISLNYSFYGNPGSGKTSVAKLFAKLLRDCKLRGSDTFVHLSPRVLKDEGADKFIEHVKNANNGVIFIDEAYNLNPIEEPKGREITNELLVVSEDLRDQVSIILAGYEDELEKKLFAYNEGLKSRFQSILFEDFDQRELEHIWNKMLKDREWTADDLIGPLISKKLVKSANRKGFGNARDVRSKLEECCKRAYARDDWKGDMILHLEDAVGVNPMQNPKLLALLEELDQQIGWHSVKQSVKELVAVCEKNHERELKGLDASTVIL